MTTDLAFLCDSALEDRGKLHALGVGIDGVSGGSLPMTHPRFVVVCVMRYSVVEAGDKRMVIRLLTPDARGRRSAHRARHHAPRARRGGGRHGPDHR